MPGAVRIEIEQWLRSVSFEFMADYRVLGFLVTALVDDTVTEVRIRSHRYQFVTYA
jgi:hypothetical protein